MLDQLVDCHVLERFTFTHRSIGAACRLPGWDAVAHVQEVNLI